MVEKFCNKVHTHLEELHENLSKYRLTPQEVSEREKALDDLLVYSKILIADLYWGNMN